MGKGERKNEEITGTLDFETDPFKAGRVPHPFACGIYFSDDDYAILWESDFKADFISRVIRALRRLPACTLYAHNGGRFDFHYLLEAAEGSIKIRNGRVTEIKIGKVTLKDSFPLMPFPLEDYRKTEIDYAIFERRRRDTPGNRKRIESYLLDDCRDLLSLVTGFRQIVGPRDTIGGAAFFQMRARGIKIQSLNETHDEMFRPYYFGGRVDAFERGIIRGPLDYIDLNSAYPDAMREHHAHGAEYIASDRLPPKKRLGRCFARIDATSNGALPRRNEETGGLSFAHGRDEFYATGWEIIAGLETKTLTIHEVLEVWEPQETICFKDYVEHFYTQRSDAKKRGDKIAALAFKYLLNSGYGKFAQNPRDFKEYKLAPYGDNVPGHDWETDFGDISLWSKSSFRGWGFFDVATGASITGYVRAKLWRAICNSGGVVYCDTDALICKASSVPRGNKLGEWKLEGIAKRVAIAGKKLYGVEWDFPAMRRAGLELPKSLHKIASKGARLSWAELLQLCKGETIIWENIAPTFSITGASFIKREIRAT